MHTGSPSAMRNGRDGQNETTTDQTRLSQLLLREREFERAIGRTAPDDHTERNRLLRQRLATLQQIWAEIR
jgi:hypothetical protein